MKPQSDLLGSNIRSLDFRARFNAAVLAVKRGGKHQEGKIGDIVLVAHDTVILLTGTTLPYLIACDQGIDVNCTC